MVAVFTTLIALATLLILPGWLWFRRKIRQSVWILGLPIFGIGVWLALTMSGVGAQSLSNIVETFGIVVAAIVFAYIKFLAFDRSPALSSRGTFIAFAAVGLIALGLRLFMPVLPE